MPLATGPYPHLMFTQEDQNIFYRCLVDEVDRLGLLRVRGIQSGSTDAALKLRFIQTQHFPDFQEYILDVSVTFHEGAFEETKTYHIVSSDGDSMLTKMTTNATEGKQKAATKLMQRIIEDLEKWVSRSLSR